MPFRPQNNWLTAYAAGPVTGRRFFYTLFVFLHPFLRCLMLATTACTSHRGFCLALVDSLQSRCTKAACILCFRALGVWLKTPQEHEVAVFPDLVFCRLPREVSAHIHVALWGHNTTRGYRITLCTVILLITDGCLLQRVNFLGRGSLWARRLLEAGNWSGLVMETIAITVAMPAGPDIV